MFNQDICILVEGASEVVLFEHIIRTLYKDDFEKISIGIIQYGGSAADGIISGSISISNIVPAQKYLYWIRDRDAKPTEMPSESSTKFMNKIQSNGYEGHILNKREIEYYYPLAVHVSAQQHDIIKENRTTLIYNSDQSNKYRAAAEADNVCVPNGKYLKRLLSTEMTLKDHIDGEIRNIIEGPLFAWKKEILGE